MLRVGRPTLTMPGVEAPGGEAIPLLGGEAIRPLGGHLRQSAGSSGAHAGAERFGGNVAAAEEIAVAGEVLGVGDHGSCWLCGVRLPRLKPLWGILPPILGAGVRFSDRTPCRVHPCGNDATHAAAAFKLGKHAPTQGTCHTLADWRTCAPESL